MIRQWFPFGQNFWAFRKALRSTGARSRMLRETKKGKHMEGLVLALFVLKKQFQRPARTITEPEFKLFNLAALRLPDDGTTRGTNRTRRPALAVSPA